MPLRIIPLINNLLNKNLHTADMYDLKLSKPINTPKTISYSTLTELEDSTKALETNPHLAYEIIHTAEKILTNESKNLMILFFWADALLIQHGFTKLEYIFLEIDSFLQLPEIKNLNDEEKTTQLNKGDVLLSKTISMNSLLTTNSFSLNDYLQAEHVMQKSLQTKDPKKFLQSELAENKSLEFFQAHIEQSNTTKEFLINSIQALDKLPHKLETCQDVCQKILQTIKKHNQKQEIDVNAITQKTEIPQHTLYSNIHNRHQAYQLIKQIATYLITQEPHAFTGYILEKLSKLENVTLSQALKDMPEIQTLLK